MQDLEKQHMYLDSVIAAGQMLIDNAKRQKSLLAPAKKKSTKNESTDILVEDALRKRRMRRYKGLK